MVYFEASVGGVIPVIQGLNEGLAGNEIKSIKGIKKDMVINSELYDGVLVSKVIDIKENKDASN